MRVRQKKSTDGKEENYFEKLISEGNQSPKTLRGSITRNQIEDILKLVDMSGNDFVDTVFALLDNNFPNLFDPACPFSDGA